MANQQGDITKYLGVKYVFPPTYIHNRAPTVNDINDEQGLYKIPSIWIHETGNIPIDNDVYILVDISAVTGTLQATWLLFTGGSGGSITKLRADDGNIAIPLAGIIDIDGNAVNNGTNATPLFTRANIANTVDIDIQVGAAITGAPADKNDAGIVSFDDMQFAVDNNGFVQLLGGGMAFDQITVDAFTVPGTNPVVPNPVTGDVAIAGAAVANHSIPIETHSRAANAFNIEVQQAIAVTPTPADNNEIGMSSFNENHFTVDATSGMVSGVGDPSIGYVQTLTGDTGGAVGPDGSGNIDFTGDQTQQFLQINGTPGSNLQEAKLIEPNGDGELLIGNTGVAEPQVGNITSTDGTVAITYNDPNINLSVVASPMEGFTNIGFDYSSPTFSITSRDGTTLSATNPATVTFNSKASPGTLVTINVTANQSFDDSSGTSNIVDNLFGLETGDDWGANDLPFFVYAVLNDAENDVTFMISRMPWMPKSPVSTEIGTPASAIADEQFSFFALNSVTVTEWDSNPLVYIGCFRMRFTQPGGADDWTVQTLSEEDGPSKNYNNKYFVYPTNVDGAAANSHFLPNGGTAPAFNNINYNYRVINDGTLEAFLVEQDATVQGSGAVDAHTAMPYKFSSSSGVGTPDIGIGHVKDTVGDPKFMCFAGCQIDQKFFVWRGWNPTAITSDINYADLFSGTGATRYVYMHLKFSILDNFNLT